MYLLNVYISNIYEPFENLSSKLIAPYTNALDSVSSPIRSAVTDRLIMSIAEPPRPISIATMKISLEVKAIFHWHPIVKEPPKNQSYYEYLQLNEINLSIINFEFLNITFKFSVGS